MNRSSMDWVRGLAVALIGLFGVATLPAGQGSAMTLDEAKASEFFGWFHLTEVLGGDASTRLFRPDGDAFRSLAAVELTTDDRGGVTRMRLILARSFIADPQKSSFARDIAKSFLRFASPGPLAPTLVLLADEIQFRDLTGRIIMRGDPPKLPTEPSDAYRVFAGETSEATLSVPGTALTFRNQTAAVPEFSITADPGR